MLLVVCLRDQSGPIVYNLYQQLDVNVQDMVGKFADYSKIDCFIDSEEVYQELQRILDQLGKWAKSGREN